MLRLVVFLFFLVVSHAPLTVIAGKGGQERARHSSSWLSHRQDYGYGGWGHHQGSNSRVNDRCGSTGGTACGTGGYTLKEPIATAACGSIWFLGRCIYSCPAHPYEEHVRLKIDGSHLMSSM